MTAAALRPELAPSRRVAVTVCVAALVVGLAPTSLGLFLLPGLLLLLVLVSGRYPGERRLSARSLRASRLPRAPRVTRRPSRAERHAVRGGGLIATALGGRPPPAKSAAATSGSRSPGAASGGALFVPDLQERHL